MTMCDFVFMWQCTCAIAQEEECPPTVGTAAFMFEAFDENEDCLSNHEEFYNLLDYRYEDPDGAFDVNYYVNYVAYDNGDDPPYELVYLTACGLDGTDCFMNPVYG